VSKCEDLLGITTLQHGRHHEFLPPFGIVRFKCSYVVVPKVWIPPRTLPIYDPRYTAFVDEDVLGLQVAVREDGGVVELKFVDVIIAFFPR
jgi:hypothetical protein